MPDSRITIRLPREGSRSGSKDVGWGANRCEDCSVHVPETVEWEVEPPRASLIAIAGELCWPALLVGGAHTLHGNDVVLEGLERAWVVDCAGEMPVAYRERAGRFHVRVFPDLEGEVAALPRLRELAAEVAAAARLADGIPERVYVMCHHGLNRSGLMMGLILRELGVGAEEAVRRIAAARPGALSNRAFRAVLEGPHPPAPAPWTRREGE
jgi:hypothetical protein